MYVQIMRVFQSQWCGFLCLLFHSLLNCLNHILKFFATSPCHFSALSPKQGQLAPVQWAITSVASRHFMIQWIWIIKHLIRPLFSREGDFKCGSGGLLWLGFLLSVRAPLSYKRLTEILENIFLLLNIPFYLQENFMWFIIKNFLW